MVHAADSYAVRSGAGGGGAKAQGARTAPAVPRRQSSLEFSVMALGHDNAAVAVLLPVAEQARNQRAAGPERALRRQSAAVAGTREAHGTARERARSGGTKVGSRKSCHVVCTGAGGITALMLLLRLLPANGDQPGLRLQRRG